MFMKKFMWAFLGLGISLSAASQSISIGPTATIGNSWLSTDRDLSSGFDNKELHVAYSKGMKMIVSFVPHWGMSSDISFSSEGGTFSNGNEDVKHVYRVNYIRHSTQGVYFFGQLGDRIRPRLSAGPSVAVFAGGKTKIKNGSNEGTQESASKNLFKTWDFGIATSAGVNFKLVKNLWLNADANYYHGLLDVNDISDNDIMNRRLGFTIGLLFGCDFKKEDFKNMHK